MPDGGDDEESGEGRVLSADELDITERQEVAPLGEGRFVVGSEGEPDAPDNPLGGDATLDASSSADGTSSEEQTGEEQTAVADEADSDASAEDSTAEGVSESPVEDKGPDSPQSNPSTDDGSTARGSTDDVTGRDVKSWLSDELTHHDSAYAHHITAKTGDEVANQQLATNDIGAAFDGLLVWYARQVATDTPVDEALGILLAESGVRVRYPTSRLVEYLDANDLGPEDSIADLVTAVSEDDGLVFTKRQ